jgi:SAM-dependent methyltransferase
VVVAALAVSAPLLERLAPCANEPKIRPWAIPSASSLLVMTPWLLASTSGRRRSAAPRACATSNNFSLLPPQPDVLELGCGAPVESTRILAERANLAGVDISEAQVALARRRLPQATFIHADLSALEFAPESFDAVVALYVLLHIPRAELEPLLGRVASWLRPSGLLANALVRGESEAVEPWLGVWMCSSAAPSPRPTERGSQTLA